jgi:hypothetical protein
LAVTPVFQRFWCGGVVAVGVDDERFLLAHGVYLVGFLKWNLNKF